MSSILPPPTMKAHGVPRDRIAPVGSPPLNLDTLMQDLSALDRAGPVTSTANSPFLASPIIASTLLFSAGKIATNAAPPVKSPTSPLVLHPVIYAAGDDAEVETKISKVFLEGQIKPIAVSAYQDLLFLVRIAKWKVAYSKGEPFDRNEQLPYCECLDIEFLMVF
jgi:hypothetical protein